MLSGFIGTNEGGRIDELMTSPGINAGASY
jgi:hypothetical protein